jgi:hypothetical protein
MASRGHAKKADHAPGPYLTMNDKDLDAWADTKTDWFREFFDGHDDGLWVIMDDKDAEKNVTTFGREKQEMEEYILRWKKTVNTLSLHNFISKLQPVYDDWLRIREKILYPEYFLHYRALVERARDHPEKFYPQHHDPDERGPSYVRSDLTDSIKIWVDKQGKINKDFWKNTKYDKFYSFDEGDEDDSDASDWSG